MFIILLRPTFEYMQYVLYPTNIFIIVSLNSGRDHLTVKGSINSIRVPSGSYKLSCHRLLRPILGEPISNPSLSDLSRDGVQHFLYV